MTSTRRPTGNRQTSMFDDQPGQEPQDSSVPLRPSRVQLLAHGQPDPELNTCFMDVSPALAKAMHETCEDFPQDPEKDEKRFRGPLKALLDAGDYYPDGNPIVTCPTGLPIDGVRRLEVIARGSHTFRVLVVGGILFERRFTINDYISGRSGTNKTLVVERPRSPPSKHRAAKPRPSGTPSDHWVLDETLALRDRVSAEIGYGILPDWSHGSLTRHLDAAGNAAALGVSEPMAVFLAACLDEIAPLHAPAFFHYWAYPSGSDSASILGNRKDEFADLVETELLSLVALAAESYVEYVDRDPFELLDKTGRKPWQLVAVLVGQPTRRPDRLLWYGRLTLSVEEAKLLLARSGCPIENWDDPAARERIEPFLMDIRREKGLYWNGQTIKLSNEGLILDGFERIAACVLEGYPVNALYVQGWREGTDLRLPTSGKRGLGAIYNCDGYPSPWDIQSSVRKLVCISTNDRDYEPTLPQMRMMHQREIQLLDGSRSVRIIEVSCPVSAILAVQGYLKRFSLSQPDAFFDMMAQVWLTTGVTSKNKASMTEWKPKFCPDTPKYAVFAVLFPALKAVEDRTSPGDARSDEAVNLLIQAHNAWSYERPLTHFEPLPPQGYPTLEMPKEIQEQVVEEKKRKKAASAPADKRAASERTTH